MQKFYVDLLIPNRVFFLALLMLSLLFSGCATTADVYSSDLQKNAKEFHTELVTFLVPYLRGETQGQYSDHTKTYDKLAVLAQQMYLDAAVAQDEANLVTVPKIQNRLEELMARDKSGQLSQKVASEFVGRFQFLLKNVLIRERSAAAVEKALGDGLPGNGGGSDDATPTKMAGSAKPSTSTSGNQASNQ